MQKNQEEKDYQIFSKNLDSEIDDIVSKNLSSKEIERVNSPFSKYFWILMTFSFIFLFAGCAIFGIGPDLLHLSMEISIIILILLSIPLFICSFFWWLHYKTINKLYSCFENVQNIQPFYNHYSDFLKSEIIVNRLDHEEISNSKIFFPVKNLPNSSVSNNYLQGFYQDYEFKIGTNTYRYLQSSSNYGDEYMDEEHLYLLVKIDQTNFQTQIFPKTGFSKFFTSKKDRENALESEEFEKFFKIQHEDDPIKLRKLLSPRVMSNLNDLAKKQKIPEIIINNDEIIIHQIVNTSVSTSSYLSFANARRKSFFCHLPNKKISRINDIKKIVKQTIERDFQKMDYYLQWVNAFKLHLNYEIKILKNQKND